jgi:hypothetical protein
MQLWRALEEASRSEHRALASRALIEHGTALPRASASPDAGPQCTRDFLQAIGCEIEFPIAWVWRVAAAQAALAFGFNILRHCHLR